MRYTLLFAALLFTAATSFADGTENEAKPVPSEIYAYASDRTPLTWLVYAPPGRGPWPAVLVIHGVDPRLQDRARALVQRLGDERPRAREEAESQLFELGPVAVPVLEDALRNNDVEIVFRAERLRLRLNRQVP